MHAVPDWTTIVVPDVYYLAAVLAVNGGLGRTKLTQAIGVLGSAKAVYEADEVVDCIWCYVRIKLNLDGVSVFHRDSYYRICHNDSSVKYV